MSSNNKSIVNNNNKPKEEKTLGEILQIINRRKILLLIATLSTVLLVFIYNDFTSPTYEASVLLKKDRPENKNINPNDFSNIINIQTSDEVETEMQLVKTWSVLSKVVDDLKLFLNVQKVVFPDGQSVQINESLIDYNHDYLENSALAKSFPKFVDAKLVPTDGSSSYYIEKTGNKEFKIYDATLNKLLQTVKDTSSATFKLSNTNIIFYWPNAPQGSKVYFNINSYYSTVASLNKSISVSNPSKTEVFEISVKSKSPISAKVIANTLADKFRATRLDQQKQTIRYSFNFIDNQLQEMQEKLKQAEENLSNFKASGQIMTIDQSTLNISKFLSSLETQKMQIDLDLTDYKNKVAEMRQEMKQAGYVDQSYLSPQGNNSQGTSPFAVLMKQLTDLQLQRLDLLQKRKETHPDVIAIDQQIDLVKKQLTNYNQNTLTAYQIIIDALQKKLLKITTLMSKYEVKMENLPSQEKNLANLTRQKDVYEKIFNMLLDKREEMRMAELSKLQDIVIVDPANAPLSPISPRKNLNLFAGFLFGLFAGILSIFIVELKNKKLVSLNDIEKDFQLPIYAIIPKYPRNIQNQIKSASDSSERFVTLMENQDGFKETYRVLKTKLSLKLNHKQKIFMVTSCEENTGKTSVVANLGLSLAQSKKNVLLIDCDLKKGTLSRIFNIPKDSPGLLTFLSQRVTSPNIYNKVLRTLDILPSGGTGDDSSDLIGSDRMEELLKILETSAYDYIILDTPPVTRVVDTLVLGRIVKDAVMILRPEHSFKDSVAWGVQEMNQAGIVISGIVVNAGEIEESSFKYRYGYGYGYNYTVDPYKLENISSVQ